MLKESPRRAVHGDHDRRWMSDDYFDLIVWYKADESIHGFQLCYGKPNWERALTWIEGRDFSHAEVDTGEEKATRNRTPVLVPDGSFPATEVIREFERRAKELPGDLRKFVIARMAEFVGRRKT